MSDALDDIQVFWASDDGLGGDYQDATLVLFTGGVSTEGCGNAPSSVGPFYCPADANAYIDLSFFKQLDRASSARRATSPASTCSPTSSGTTCRTCSAPATEVRQAQQGASQERGQRALRAARAPGRLLRRASGATPPRSAA